MKITVVDYKEFSKAGAVFLPLFAKEPPHQEEVFSYLPPEVKKSLAVFAQKEFAGEEGEMKIFWSVKSTQKIILAGLGEKNKWLPKKLSLAARRMARFAKTEKIKDFSVALKKDFGLPFDSAKTLATNLEMADFEFNRYKKIPDRGWPEVKSINVFSGSKNFKEIKDGLRVGQIIGQETNACRNLANTPGGDITPRMLAEAARKIATQNKIAIKILTEREMKKIGMGGILGVSKGSAEKPRFIIVEYFNGPKNQKPLVVVGKGVTFDTGGLNIKPDQYMYEMHMDMSGGAAAMHGLAAVARLNLPINMIVVVPAVENMLSGSSYRPGDILKTMSGQTVEVLNTDAEGRIILADALTYSLRYKPGFILDLATLTGAAHVALGNYYSALFTNQDKKISELMKIGNDSGDYVWPLPLGEEFLNDIKGNFADLANTGKTDRYGGASHGAKFLEQFVENTPWVHLDIAPRMTTVESDCLAKGASGVGVRYVVELAKNYKDF